MLDKLRKESEKMKIVVYKPSKFMKRVLQMIFRVKKKEELT